VEESANLAEILANIVVDAILNIVEEIEFEESSPKRQAFIAPITLQCN
jgi:hypothetical protein